MKSNLSKQTLIYSKFTPQQLNLFMLSIAITAEVKTDTRRIIEFFLAPLLQHG
jgi:hypothetical protein